MDSGDSVNQVPVLMSYHLYSKGSLPVDHTNFHRNKPTIISFNTNTHINTVYEQRIILPYFLESKYWAWTIMGPQFTQLLFLTSKFESCLKGHLRRALSGCKGFIAEVLRICSLKRSKIRPQSSWKSIIVITITSSQFISLTFLARLPVQRFTIIFNFQSLPRRNSTLSQLQQKI